jgi:hypothetical protein
MTINSKIELHAHPDIKLGVTSEPVDFEISCDGEFKLSVGPIKAHVDRVPVFVRIPFLKRHSGGIIAAAVGPFNVHIHDFAMDVRAAQASARGKLGKDRLHGDLEAKGACKLDIDISAEVPAKALNAALKSALQE